MNIVTDTRRRSVDAHDPAATLRCGSGMTLSEAKLALSALRATPLPPGDEWDEETVDRLRAFQHAEGFPPTGILDEATATRLARRSHDVAASPSPATAAAGPTATMATEASDAHGPLDTAVTSFLHGTEGAAHALFADAQVRARYLAEAADTAAIVQNKVATGALTVGEGEYVLNTLRNDAMAAARKDLSPFARAVSEALKKEGLSILDLSEKYAQRIFNRPYVTLTKGEAGVVGERIVARAGVTNPTMNAAAKIGPRVGGTFIAVSVALAVYHIAHAEDRVGEAVRQGASLGGGAVGFKVGGLMGGMLCGPPCAVIGALAVGIASAYAGEKGADVGYRFIKG